MANTKPVGVLIANLIIPGLGSSMAEGGKGWSPGGADARGNEKQGFHQLALFVGGLAMIFPTFIFALGSLGTAESPFLFLVYLAPLGLFMIYCSWVWALITSLSVMKLRVAIISLIANIFMPGSGSLVIGRKKIGLLQLALWNVSFVLGVITGPSGGAFSLLVIASVRFTTWFWALAMSVRAMVANNKRSLVIIVVIGLILTGVFFGTHFVGPGPQQVVDNFFQLIKADKYQEAYDNYLSEDIKSAANFEQFQTAFQTFKLVNNLTTSKAVIDGDSATVNVTAELFGSEDTFPFTLKKENGKWKLSPQ
jgi:hypothetical protein